MTPRPHTSAAIVQLRQWVWMAAAALVVCASIQMLVFGFVHYTDVRWTVLEAKVERVPAEVVRGSSVPVKPAVAAAPGAPEPADLNHVLNENDRLMGRALQLGSTAGVIAAVWLMALTSLGVVVAGGAAVPGVERAVRAAAWSMVLALFCLPLKDVLPSLPWNGVFGSYAGLTAASEAARAGHGSEVSLLLEFLALPLVVVVSAVAVGVWFRTGVEQGVLLTVGKHVDEALERELAVVRTRGVSGGTVAGGAARATGALTKTMGEAPAAPALLKAAAGAESMSATATEDDANGWRIGKPMAGKPEKRLI